MEEAGGKQVPDEATLKSVETQEPFLIVRTSSKEATLLENELYKKNERETEKKMSTNASGGLLEDEKEIRDKGLKKDITEEILKESVVDETCLPPPTPLKEESASSVLETSSAQEPGLVGRSLSLFDGGGSAWGRDFCRICHEAEAAESLISPCSCRGSMSVVHRSCLERWLAEADSSSCELCGYVYTTQRFPRYGVMASVWAWLWSREAGRERRELAFDFLCFLTFTPLVTLGTYLGCVMTETLFNGGPEERAEILTLFIDQEGDIQIAEPLGSGTPSIIETASNLPGRMALMSVISMMTTLDLAFASWIFLRLQHHCAQWYSWYRRHSKVKLLPPNSDHSDETDG